MIREVTDPNIVRQLDDAQAALESTRIQSQEMSEENQRLIEHANELDADKQRMAADIAATAEQLAGVSGERDTLVSVNQQKDEEVKKLAGWVDQLQNDLRAAIQLAQERNDKLNEMMNAQPTSGSNFDASLGFEQRYFTNLKPASDFTGDPADSGRADFGTKFPTDPGRGDLYLRVDMLPSQLYKWNGAKWIEVDKNSTDRLAYNAEYINHLIEKLREGVYDIDELNDTERAQIEARLNGRTV